jgi:hypothetical protein
MSAPTVPTYTLTTQRHENHQKIVTEEYTSSFGVCVCCLPLVIIVMVIVLNSIRREGENQALLRVLERKAREGDPIALEEWKNLKGYNRQSSFFFWWSS